MPNYEKIKIYAKEIKNKCPIQQSDRTELSRQFLYLLNEYKDGEYNPVVQVRLIKLFKGFLFDFIHIIQGTPTISIK